MVGRRFNAFEGKTVLDLGCNDGYLLDAFLREEEFTAKGADISERDLAEARHLYGDCAKWDTFLNGKTIRRSNRMLAGLPFEVVHQECIGFGGKTFRRARAECGTCVTSEVSKGGASFRRPGSCRLSTLGLNRATQREPPRDVKGG